MADVTMKQHDTYPPLQAQLKQDDFPVYLGAVGTTVRLILKTRGLTPTVIVDEMVTIVDVDEGLVEYEWESADTATVNTLDGEFEIEFPGAGLTTYPNQGYFEVAIVPDLD